MKKQIFWLFLAALGLCTACTVEKETSGTSADGGKELQDVRHEVLLTFKNKLVIPGKETKTTGTTKAGDTPLATAQENAVTSLDVYVFASDSETGNYTFQERLSYRASGIELPAGSQELEVEAGSKENEFTSLLKLQKGLFVKLYCIANQPLLVDPADEGNVITDTYFQPLTQTTPGQAGSKVATEGIPSESLFQSFHTPFITAAGDTLVCPLPMSGAYTQPLDLTDYSVSSRMQVGFKLTRAVARFDIINNAALSRFTIDSIGMANGRKAVTFFPIQAYGDQPTAQPDELITYPLRAFSGDKANLGTQTGAFYAYPSFPSDETGLILKGRYKINETETKETSYPVAFKQTDAQGNGAYIEINPNHRYTIAITQADEQKLQTNIITSDWADDGSIDEYNPGETGGEVAVSVAAGFEDKSQWDAATRTLNLSLEAGSSAGVSVTTNSAVLVSKRYSGRDQSYDWLEVSAPTVAQTKAFTAFGYQYTLSLKDGYAKNRYPKVTLRFTDAVTGEESIVFVEAVASPELIEIPKVPGDTNLNSLNLDSLTASVFRTTGSSLQIRFLCPDGVDVESAPSWLKVEKTKEEGAETTFTVTLVDRDVSDTEGTIVFHNSKKPDDLKTDIKVRLEDAGIAPSFSSLGGNNNQYVPGTDGTPDEIKMSIKNGNTFTVGSTSIRGVQVSIDFNGGPAWLKHNGEEYAATARAAVLSDSPNTQQGDALASSMSLYAGSKKDEITFSLDTARLAGAKPATVTLKNKTGGKDCVFTVTPDYTDVEVSIVSSVPVDNKLESRAFTLYKLPATVSTVTLRVVSYGGSKLGYTGTGLTLPSTAENPGNESEYTLTVTGASTGGKLKVMNYTDNTKFTEYDVTTLLSDIAVTTPALTLTATNGQKAQTAVSSPLGFTAEVTDWGGGTQWFGVTKAWAGGSVNFLATANTGNSKARPATVTLTNKIVNGGNQTVTVTPAYTVPTVSLVANSASPTPNTLSGTTVKLYKVSGSKINIKASAIGGSQIQSASGVTVSAVAGTDNYHTERVYTVTWNGSSTSGSFTIINSSDNTKKTGITVQLLSPITVANSNLTLTASNGQRAQTNVTSVMGFTAAVTNWNGGTSWFSVTKDWAAGTVAFVATANTANSKARPATVTLTNKMAGAAAETLTVTPAYTVPAVSLVANTASPTQNTFSGTTIKLYRVSGSRIQIKASAIGGSQIQSATGVTVSAVAGTDNYNTDRTYTVTWNGSATSGSFTIVNSSDNSKKTAITVQLPSPSITVPSGSANINLVANQTGSKASLSSPEGFTVSVNSINWGGGVAWFDLTTTDVAGGSNKSVGVKVKSNVTSLMPSQIKTATVTLANKIANGGNATFTVSPGWSAPANASGQSTSFIVNAGANAEIRVSTSYPFGGIGVNSSSGSVSYQSLDTNTGIITLKGNSAGSSTIKVYNSQDANKYISYAVTVKTIPSSSYITITNGGMTRKWAVGNLVAQGSSSCAIGSAADKGLMFKFGSLVGYDANNSAVNPTCVVKPNAYSSSPSFKDSPYNNVGTAVPASGTGDPCRYYLGGSWRLPTETELRNNLGGGVSGSANFKVWQWVTSPTNGICTGPSKQLFFPAAGYRSNSSGSLGSSGSSGYVWSSTLYGTSGAYCLKFYASGASVYNNVRSDGFSVRCVQE